MAMGECSDYSSLQADSKVKFAAWPTSWRPPGEPDEPQWTLAYGWRRRWKHYKYRPGYYYNYYYRDSLWKVCTISGFLVHLTDVTQSLRCISARVRKQSLDHCDDALQSSQPINW